MQAAVAILDSELCRVLFDNVRFWFFEVSMKVEKVWFCLALLCKMRIF